MKTHFPALVDTEIVESLDNDYRFRILPKAVWVPIIAALATEIDYGNFESAVAQRQGPSGRAYEAALHAIWSIMRRLQQPHASR